MSPRRRSKDDSFADHYLRGLGLSTRNNSLAYGFSVAVTATFGVLDRLRGTPTVAEVFYFVVGAALPFSILNPIVTRGFRRRVESEPRMVVALGTSLAVISISASVGIATLIGWALGDWAAWLVGPFASTTVYLAAGALEMALARTLHVLAGTENLERR